MGLLRACLLLLLGCVPPRHVYEGFACNADEPCPEPLVCRDGSCQREAMSGGSAAGGAAGGISGGTAGGSLVAGGAAGGVTSGGGVGGGAGGAAGGASSRVSLTRNGGFEELAPSVTLGWQTTGGTITADTQLSHAGTSSMRIDAPSTEVRSRMAALFLSPGAGVYCAEVWMRGAGTARLSLEYTSVLSGSGQSSDRPEANATLSSSAWLPLRNRVTVDDGVTASSLVLTVSPTPSLWLDDVVVWRSAAGDCRE